MYQGTGGKDFIWNAKWLNRIVYPEVVNTVRYGEYLYGFTPFCNVLSRITLSTGEVTYLNRMPLEDTDKFLVQDIKLYKNYIVLASNLAKHMYVYDIEKNVFVLVKECEDVYEKTEKRMMRIIVHEDKVIFFPAPGKNVLYYDMKTLTAKSTDFLFKSYLSCIKKEGEQLHIVSICNKDDLCYGISHKSNCLMEFSLDLRSFAAYSFDEELYRACAYEEYVYILTKKGKVLKWSTKKKRVISDWSIDFRDENRINCLGEAIIQKQTIYFLSTCLAKDSVENGYGIKIDVEHQQVSVICFEDEFKIKAAAEEYYSFSSIDEEGNIYFISTYQNMHIYNTNTKLVRKFSLKYRENLKFKNINKKRINNIGKNCWDVLQTI